jgi:hypothetical protein
VTSVAWALVAKAAARASGQRRFRKKRDFMEFGWFVRL